MSGVRGTNAGWAGHWYGGETLYASAADGTTKVGPSDGSPDVDQGGAQGPPEASVPSGRTAAALAAGRRGILSLLDPCPAQPDEVVDQSRTESNG